MGHDKVGRGLPGWLQKRTFARQAAYAVLANQVGQGWRKVTRFPGCRSLGIHIDISILVPEEPGKREASVAQRVGKERLRTGQSVVDFNDGAEQRSGAVTPSCVYCAHL